MASRALACLALALVLGASGRPAAADPAAPPPAGQRLLVLGTSRVRDTTEHMATIRPRRWSAIQPVDESGWLETDIWLGAEQAGRVLPHMEVELVDSEGGVLATGNL